MFEGINIIAIIGTTFFMLASATVWFSPMMFGKWWLQSLRVTEAEIEASQKNVVFHLGLMAIGYALALSVLAVMSIQFVPLVGDPLQASLVLSILVVALMGTTALWENKGLKYFLINAFFYTYFVIVGVYMLNYWPW